MTIQECYKKLGGNYTQIKELLGSDVLVRRFIGKFLNDKSFDELTSALSEGNVDKAFRAAHTLKGVSGNLGFTGLYNSANKLTSLLRNADTVSSEAEIIFEELNREYNRTVTAVRAYLEENNFCCK